MPTPARRLASNPCTDCNLEALDDLGSLASPCDNPSGVRISLSGEAEPAIGHDDAIGPPQFESEWMAMRICGSRRLEEWGKLRKVIQWVGSDRSR
jgi:hypothetical protein